MTKRGGGIKRNKIYNLNEKQWTKNESYFQKQAKRSENIDEIFSTNKS